MWFVFYGLFFSPSRIMMRARFGLRFLQVYLPFWISKCCVWMLWIIMIYNVDWACVLAWVLLDVVCFLFINDFNCKHLWGTTFVFYHPINTCFASLFFFFLPVRSRFGVSCSVVLESLKILTLASSTSSTCSCMI